MNCVISPSLYTRTLTVLCLLLVSAWANAAEQIPDTISIHSKSLELLAEPLEDYWKITGIDKPFLSLSAAQVVDKEHVRGYTSHWQIKDGRLYLISISGWMLDPEYKSGTNIPTPVGRTVKGRDPTQEDFLPLSLSSIFPKDRIGPDGVFANWYSGQLRVSAGPVLVQGKGPGYACLHTKELLIPVRKGVIAESALTLDYSSFKTDSLNTR
jgi:hypothetical protein